VFSSLVVFVSAKKVHRTENSLTGGYVALNP
jgi:hypothetical protein